MLTALAAATSCANMHTRSPVTGLIYTDVVVGERLGTGSATTKIGEATCSSILGWFATGDCSIDAAMQQGGLRTVHHVDSKVSSILGIYSSYTLVVVGE